MSVLLIWLLNGCAPPGGNRDIPQIKLTIQNTLPIKRANVPIVLSLTELRQIAPDFSLDAYLVVSGQPAREIPSQADDTNYDGQRDELVFLVDLQSQETMEVSIRYSPENQVAVTLGFVKLTRAGIFPELGGFAALESDLVAYLLDSNGSIRAFGKKPKLLFRLDSVLQSDLEYGTGISPPLRQVFGDNNITLSQDATIEVLKQGSSWTVADPQTKQKYGIRTDTDGLNVYQRQGLAIDRYIYHAEEEIEDMMTPLDGHRFGSTSGFGLWEPPRKGRYLLRNQKTMCGLSQMGLFDPLFNESYLI